MERFKELKKIVTSQIGVKSLRKVDWNMFLDETLKIYSEEDLPKVVSQFGQEIVLKMYNFKTNKKKLRFYLNGLLMKEREYRNNNPRMEKEVRENIPSPQISEPKKEKKDNKFFIPEIYSIPPHTVQVKQRKNIFDKIKELD